MKKAMILDWVLFVPAAALLLLTILILGLSTVCSSVGEAIFTPGTCTPSFLIPVYDVTLGITVTSMLAVFIWGPVYMVAYVLSIIQKVRSPRNKANSTQLERAFGLSSFLLATILILILSFLIFF